MKILSKMDSLDNVQDGATRKLITKTTSSGSGNVVSSVSVSGDTITYTKGVSALTAHQNTFSTVKVGSTNVVADQAGDTLELVAGSNVTLTPDATNDKVTIAATDTTYESKAAASGGTDVSLVTTGEKYTWNNKQNALNTQTAYSAKGTATKVPQITTNTLGQVTKIEEVTITQPTVNNGTLTIQKNGTNVQTFSANQSGNATANITVPTKTSDLTNDSGYVTTNTTYTFATGDSNGQIKVTPSGGSAQNIDVKGLGSLAYKSSLSKSDVGLGNVDNTSDANKPISTATQSALDKKAKYLSLGSCADFQRVVIGLCELSANASSGTSSHTSGSLVTIRSNGLVPEYVTNFVFQDQYSGAKSCNYSFMGNFENTSTTLRQGEGFRACTFTYNNKYYGGLEFYQTQARSFYWYGESNFTPFLVAYYNFSTGDVLNSEINNSITHTGSVLNRKNIIVDEAKKATGDKNGDDITTTYYKASNPNGYTSNTGTITGITMNGTSKGTSGVVDLGTVLTSHQSIKTINNNTITGTGNVSVGTITGVSVNGTSVATSGTANITSMPASILSGAIPSAVTATTQSQGDNSTKIATTAYVDTAIDNLPEPMVFKGSLGTGGTITALPVDGSASIGDTYKVITAGTYASKAAKVGDTFICLTKTSSANTWELIPSGDEPSGTVTSITIKGSSPITVDSESAITTSGTRTISHANSGVTAGTYKSVTVNATGHVTGGSNPTTLSGYGITDAKIASGVITLGSNTITPLTSSSTLDATKLSGTIPSGCYTNTTYTAGTGLTLDGTQFKHTNSVTAATAGTSSATSGSTLAVPYVTYDAQGHVTASGTHTHTVTGFATSDTKNTAGSTDTSSKIFLVGATSQAANPQTYSDNEVFATNGVLQAKSFSVNAGATIEYNSTNKCIEFNFS